MKLLEKVGSAVKKAALATVALGGFLGFAGAGMASAHPRVVVGVGIGGPVVVRGYLAPAYVAARPYYGPVYAGPRYGFAYHRRQHLRYWDARFHCWR